MQGPEAAEGFEWDDDLLEHGNTAHLAESRPGRPSIAWFEAEEVFYNGGVLVPNKRNKSGDWLLVGALMLADRSLLWSTGMSVGGSSGSSPAGTVPRASGLDISRTREVASERRTNTS